VHTLARFSFRRRRWVLAAWVAVVLALGIATTTIGSAYDDQFSLPDSEGTQALALLQRVSPQAAGDQLTAVVHVERGSVRDPAVQRRLTAALDRAQRLDTVAAIVSPYSPGGAAQVSRDGRTAFATVRLDGLVPNDVTNAQVDTVLETITAESGDGTQIEVTGSAAVAPPTTGVEELVGLAAAAVVLLVVFGSLVAMSLPIITAVLSILVSPSTIGLATQVFTVATFAPTLSILLGLGVGVDYALFIVTRYRQGLLEGKSPQEATVTALSTSGRAVLFAGITVCIALLGLFAIGLSFLYGVAVAASLAVAITVVANLTLLPALLGFFGRRVLPKRLRDRPAADPAELQQETRGWQRWATLVSRRPVVLGTLALAVMLALASPFLHLRLGLTDQGSDPAASTTRQGYDLLAEGFGAGFNGPLLIVTDLGERPSPAATDALRAALATDPDVAAVTPTTYLGDGMPGTPTEGGVGITTVYPISAPQDAATSELVSRVRSDLVPAALADQPFGQRLLVGGSTALGEDFSAAIAGKLPLFFGVVVLLSSLLLTMVFRSVVVAAVAAGMNLLSAAAAFGIVVAVFQDGIGLSLLGNRPHRANPGLFAGDPVRDPVRPVDGLRGLFAQPHPRGVAPPGRQPPGRPARPRSDPSHHHRRRRDHGHAVPCVRARPRPDDRAVRLRTRSRRAARRGRRALGARARGDAAAQQRQLVPAPLARPGAADARRRGRGAGRARRAAGAPVGAGGRLTPWAGETAPVLDRQKHRCAPAATKRPNHLTITAAPAVATSTKPLQSLSALCPLVLRGVE